MAATLTFTCVHPGAESRVVDRGRPGLRALGVPAGGPADVRAAATANKLLGQGAQDPCLEFTLRGGSWLISGSGQLTFTGADMNWRLNGQLIEPYAVLYLDGDYLLTGGYAIQGCRSYLAVAGSWDLPLIRGSMEPGLPGIPVIEAGFAFRVVSGREVPYQSELEVDQHWPVLPLRLPVRPGPDWSLLPLAYQEWLLKTEFTLGQASNRQGLRLKGAEPAPTERLPALLSAPVLPGTVQVTPEGPILLGPDGQTVGGYLRGLVVGGNGIAQAFQLKPKDKVLLS